jgi:predicted ATPase
MITSVQYKNFKALRDATLPLSRFTLIVGPNGSGKSTAMKALALSTSPVKSDYNKFLSAGLAEGLGNAVEVKVRWTLTELETRKFQLSLMSALRPPGSTLTFDVVTRWEIQHDGPITHGPRFEGSAVEYASGLTKDILGKLKSFKIFSLDAEVVTQPVTMRPEVELDESGRNLAGVLDNLRDSDFERFEALNEELGRWIPEFDRITFETPKEGQKAFILRTREGKHKIRAADLSHGTLLALTFLTIAYLPKPPAVVCFEEPERGIHPRLLRNIRDAMYRLSYPEKFGDKRAPVQVIATTHSPYFLDLYRDFPEEVVIAQKGEAGVQFERLVDKPDVNEFLQDAPLGEVWFTGVLGGVPVNS